MSVFPLTEEERMELEALREAFTSMQWAHRMERFHALDAIKDDLCPCCSSPVQIEETPNSVRLKPRG
jgi:hypothetical protein